MSKKTNNIEEKKIEWVDVHDSDLMISLGIQPPNLVSRDKTVWTKTLREKKILKKLRLRHKHSVLVSGAAPRKKSSVYGKLIVYIKGKDVPKTTYSYKMCNLSDIRDILNHFRNNDGSSSVLYYSWMGKRYSFKEIPNGK